MVSKNKKLHTDFLSRREFLTRTLISGVAGVTATSLFSENSWGFIGTRMFRHRSSSVVDIGEKIPYSLLLDSASSQYLSRSVTTLGNRKTWTFSAWFKRVSLGGTQCLLSAGDGTTGNHTSIRLSNSGYSPNDVIDFVVVSSSTVRMRLVTNTVLRDIGGWYHLVAVLDTDNPIAADRQRLYLNGKRITSFQTETQIALSSNEGALNYNYGGTGHRIGQSAYTSELFSGYISELHFIDGQALDANSFGRRSIDTNAWVPLLYQGTYGQNGFKLSFLNSSSLGLDSSGNVNNWSLSGGLSSASRYLDSPTYNCCVWNTLQPSQVATITQGNLTTSTGAGGYGQTKGNFNLSYGKWYWEITVSSLGWSSTGNIGISNETETSANNVGASGGYSYTSAGSRLHLATANAYGSAYAAGDIIGVAFDADAGSLTFYKNGVSLGVAFTGITGSYTPAVSDNHTAYGAVYIANFGQKAFSYSIPKGFKPLVSTGFRIPLILNPMNYLNASLYAGTESLQNLTTVGFKPDLIWIKGRNDATGNHKLVDSVRGASSGLIINSSNAETSDTTGIQSFNDSGFSVGSDTTYNKSGINYVAYSFKQGANPGFKIVSYTGNGANRTISHNLKQVPKMMIIKSKSAASTNWVVYHNAVSATPQNSCLFLNTTDSLQTSATYWNNTAPTSSDFSVSTSSHVNQSGAQYLAYLFSEIPGYSCFGKYTGNASADGPFVWCGFSPQLLIIKRVDTAGSNWMIFDSKRQDRNAQGPALFTNSTGSEVNDTNRVFDFLCNGFKIRVAAPVTTEFNGSGGTFIFAAFAESPFSYSTAR